MKKALCEQIKLLAERIAPEAAEDSKKLLQILNKHWRYSDPGELDTEEQELLKKYDLKFDKGDHDIYPNELDTSDPRDSYKRRRYGVYNSGSSMRNIAGEMDLTQMGRKRLQRDEAGSTNKHHGYGRTSDEQKRLKDAVSDAKYDLDVATRNNWEDDKKKAERSLKIRQGKLDKENQRLKDIRKKNSYQNQEREEDEKRVSQNVNDYKDSKREIKWTDRRDADFAKDREEETRRFMDRMKEIDNRAAENDKQRQWHKDRINKLLRRDKKMESMKRYRDIMEQLANVPADDTASTEKPAYAAAIRDIKEADKKRDEYRKIPSAHVEREENPKNPKMADGAKKLMLDESLFETVISEERQSQIDYYSVGKVKRYFRQEGYNTDQAIDSLIDWADSIGKLNEFGNLIDSLAERCESFLEEEFDNEKLLPDEFDELYATLDTNPEIEDLYNQNRDADTLDNFYNAVEDRFPNVEFYGYDWKESEEASTKYKELIAAGYEVTLNPAYEGTDAYGLIAIKSNLNESVIYAKPGKYINTEEGEGVYIIIGSNGKITETSHGKIINDGFGTEINGTKYTIVCPGNNELHAYSYDENRVHKGIPFVFKLAE